jgi:phosphoenolpyruvate carboxykinase (ATP)
VHNASVPVLVEAALQRESGSYLTSTGALAVRSGAKTGRSPKDKRIVEESASVDNVWWGPVNIKMEEKSFMLNREYATRLHRHTPSACRGRTLASRRGRRALDYLHMRDRIFVVDGYAGWDPKYRVNVRVLCSRAYHALFMKNMLVRRLPLAYGTPTEPPRLRSACVLQVEVSPADLDTFVPDLVIINAGGFPANRCVHICLAYVCMHAYATKSPYHRLRDVISVHTSRGAHSEVEGARGAVVP